MFSAKQRNRKEKACEKEIRPGGAGCADGDAGARRGGRRGNTIIIGCDMYAPYTYKNGTGEFVGVDVDFATEAFGRLGYAVQFREIVWENKQSYLDSGEIDCLWSCFTMSGREDEYTWAGPYLCSRQVAMVRADSDYTELSQLAGKRAAVRASTTAEKALLRRENRTCRR
ncbi:MAG: transporter substrate-binding domain-containing protein [Christensenellales bacterium]